MMEANQSSNLTNVNPRSEDNSMISENHQNSQEAGNALSKKHRFVLSFCKNYQAPQSAKSIVADHHNSVTQFNPETARKELWQISELLQNPHLTPVKGDKNPYQKDWQSKRTPVWSIDYEIDIGRAYGFGLVTGNGYFAFDIDGQTAQPLLEQLFSCKIPETVSWTSGKEGKYQLLYKIPESYLDHFLGKTRTVIWSESGEGLELRYERCQSVLPPSKHPETGKYYWLNSPYDTEIAELPESVCERVLEKFEHEQKSNKSKNYSKSKGSKNDGYIGNSCFSNIIDKIDNALSLDEKYDWHGHNFARKSENEIWGYCPNHTSQSGTAFQINLTDHTWYCFGCEKGGKFPQYKAFRETGDTKANGKYFIQILEKYGDRAGYDVQELLEQEHNQFTKFKPDIEIYQDFIGNAPELKDKSFKQIEGNKAIKSFKKSGKTTLIKDKKKQRYKINYISSREFVTRNFAETSGLDHINDVSQSHLGIVANLDSVNRITPANEESDILVLDEAESIFKHLITGSTTIKSRRKQVLNKLQKMIDGANEVWLLDAFLTDSTVSFFEEVFGIKFCKIENTKKNKLKSVTKIAKKDIDQLVTKFAKQNKRLFILTDSKNTDGERLKSICEQYGNTLFINSETKSNYPEFLENPTQYIYENNIQFIVATNCLGIGFSIENYDYFDAVIGSFPHGINDSRDICQFLCRLRDFEVERYIHIGAYKKGYDKQLREQLLYLLDNNQQITDEEKENAKTYIELELESNLQKGLDLLLTRDEIEKNNYLKSCWDLIAECCEKINTFEGFEEEELEKTPSNKEVKEKLARENAQKILNADDSKWSLNSDDTFYSINSNEKDESWKKQHYKRQLDGIEESEHWNEEAIKKLEKGYYKKVKNYYNLEFYEQFEHKQTQKLLNHFSQDKFYADINTTNDLYIKILHDIGIFEIIERGFYFSNNDDLVNQIEQRLDNHLWGHKIPKDKYFNRTLNKMLASLGLSISKRTKKHGYYVRYIEHDPFFIFTYTRILVNQSKKDEAVQIAVNSSIYKKSGGSELLEKLKQKIEQKQKSQNSSNQDKKQNQTDTKQDSDEVNNEEVNELQHLASSESNETKLKDAGFSDDLVKDILGTSSTELMIGIQDWIYFIEVDEQGEIKQITGQNYDEWCIEQMKNEHSF